MSEVSFRGIEKRFDAAVARAALARPRRARRRVPRAARPFGLRQDDRPARARRPRAPDRRHRAHRRPRRDAHPAARPRRRDGVPELRALSAHDRGREHRLSAAHPRARARPTSAPACRQVAESLEIPHLLDRRPRHLSGGQRQRVALARAIVREPSVFLMDEPLSNLDAKLRTSMRGEIKRLQKRLGTTTLYVTHDQAEAMTMADLVAVMREGELQQLAPPDEIYDRPANRFVAAFVGNPPMNVLEGGMDESGQSFRSATSDSRWASSARPARRPARRRSVYGRKTSRSSPRERRARWPARSTSSNRWATRRSSTCASATSA